MEDLRVCLVQDRLVWEDPTANRNHFAHLLEGSEGRFDLVLLPEMFTTGFTMDPRGKGESMNGPSIAWMQELATRLGAVVAGSMIVEEDDEYYNHEQRFMIGRMAAILSDVPSLDLAEFRTKG